jgi:hypothetical protein
MQGGQDAADHYHRQPGKLTDRVCEVLGDENKNNEPARYETDIILGQNRIGRHQMRRSEGFSEWYGQEAPIQGYPQPSEKNPPGKAGDAKIKTARLAAVNRIQLVRVTKDKIRCVMSMRRNPLLSLFALKLPHLLTGKSNISITCNWQGDHKGFLTLEPVAQAG